MDLGYGFTKGRNKVLKRKIQYWLHLDYEINWKAFLWHMTQYITIVDYGISNYLIDKTNDLYKNHNEGYQHNSHIMERLVAEDA